MAYRANLSADGELRGSIGAGSIIVNDYTIDVSEIEGGHRLTVKRGSQTQVMDVMDGTSLTDEALAEIAQEAAARVDFPVDSVNSQTGAVVLGAADVGADPAGSAAAALESARDELQPKGDYLTSESDPTVPAWAKAPNKPAYTAEEVGALPDDTVIPDVPDWAMQPNKPTYTAQEVGALPNTTVIPDVPVQDVQVGGVSVVSGGVASVPSVREVLAAPITEAAPAWSAEEQAAARERMGIASREAELLATYIIDQDGITQVVPDHDFGWFTAITAGLSIPATPSGGRGVFLRLEARNGSQVAIGGAVGNNTNMQSARYVGLIEGGVVAGNAQVGVAGWGGGDFKGINSAGNITISDAIRFLRIYSTDGKDIPKGTTISVYGVRA